MVGAEEGDSYQPHSCGSHIGTTGKERKWVQRQKWDRYTGIDGNDRRGGRLRGRETDRQTEG